MALPDYAAGESFLPQGWHGLCCPESPQGISSPLTCLGRELEIRTPDLGDYLLGISTVNPQAAWRGPPPMPRGTM